MMLGDLKQPNIDAHKMLYDAWGPKKAQYWCSKMFYGAWGPKTAWYRCLQDVI